MRPQPDPEMAVVKQDTAQDGISPTRVLMDCDWTRAARTARRVAWENCILMVIWSVSYNECGMGACLQLMQDETSTRY